MGQVVKGGQGGEGDRTVEVEDGGPSQGAETAVDAPYVLIHVALKLDIVIHLGPGRYGHHDQDYLLPVLGVFFQKELKGVQAFGNPLGVVQAVHGEDHLPVPNTPLEALDFGFDLGELGGPGELEEVYAYGKGVHLHQAFPGSDEAQAVVVAQDAPHTAEEVANVVVGVESHQVGSQESFQDLFPPGQEAKELEGGKGDVEEEAYGGLGESLPKHTG